MIFFITAFIALYLTRKFLVPAIPETLFSFGDFLVTKDIAIMLFFGFLQKQFFYLSDH